MTAPTVVVVDPQTPGNIGTIARSMKNFGFSDLVLVAAPELDPDGEAYGMAGQARDDVLPGHRRLSFDAVVEQYYTVGFTAVTNRDAAAHVRYPFTTPAALGEELAAVEQDTALVFGREDNGLTNDELAVLDRVCSIPGDESYPVLNLGQAATIALYELRDLTVDETQLPDIASDRATADALERCHDQFGALLSAIDHPEPKRDKTARLFRRLLGRARPTDREAITLTGVLRRSAEYAVPPGDRADDKPTANGPANTSNDTDTEPTAEPSSDSDTTEL